MRTLIIVAALLTLSVSAFAQGADIPTFTVTSNDVVQSSIRVFRKGGTNEVRVTVKFEFTDAGAKRLEQFYRSHTVGQEVRCRIGTFEHTFKLDDRKHFGREGYWDLPEWDAKALEAGLKVKGVNPWHSSFCLGWQIRANAASCRPCPVILHPPALPPLPGGDTFALPASMPRSREKFFLRSHECRMTIMQ